LIDMGNQLATLNLSAVPARSKEHGGTLEARRADPSPSWFRISYSQLTAIFRTAILLEQVI
jgi:hypothetical protein